MTEIVDQIQKLNQQLIQKDEIILMMKTKTKDFVQKLKDDHTLQLQKIKDEHTLELTSKQQQHKIQNESYENSIHVNI